MNILSSFFYMVKDEFLCLLHEAFPTIFLEETLVSAAMALEYILKISWPCLKKIKLRSLVPILLSHLSFLKLVPCCFESIYLQLSLSKRDGFPGVATHQSVELSIGLSPQPRAWQSLMSISESPAISQLVQIFLHSFYVGCGLWASTLLSCDFSAFAYCL